MSINDNDAPPSPPLNNGNDDVVSISGSLLDDVHIDFGHEEEEDSVFDQNLMHYLDQLPIAAPPADAKYSPSFVDRVLNDVETFKQEAKHLNYDDDTNEPSSLVSAAVLDLSPFASEGAYYQDAFSAAAEAVEQPRRNDNPQEQDEEIPIHFTMQHQDDHRSIIIQPALSIEDQSTEYSDYLDLFNLGQDRQPNDDTIQQQQQQEEEATFLAQRKAELDALFSLNEDASKDFSSWLYYSDDDASQIHFNDDIMSHPASALLHQDTNHTAFSTEYPIESKYDPFSVAEKSYSNVLSPPPPLQPPQFPAEFTTTYGDASQQSAREFLQRMTALVAERSVQPPPPAPDHHTNTNKSSATLLASHYAKTNGPPPPPRHTSRTTRRRSNSSSVNIAKADFMFVSPSPSSSCSKYSNSLSPIIEKKEQPIDDDNSFVNRIAGTTTPPVKKNVLQKKRHVASSRLPVNKSSSTKRRSAVLEEMDKNAQGGTTTTTANSNISSHRYSMRARTSPPGVIRKTSTTTPNKPPVKPSRTFNLGSGSSSSSKKKR